MTWYTRLRRRLRLVIGSWLTDRGLRPPSHWWIPIVITGLLAHGVTLWRLIAQLGPGLRPPLRDSIIFEYIGWYMTVGGRLYLDAWEIKPPLSFELTAILTVLAGGNIELAHWFSVLITVLAGIAGAILVGVLVLEVTGDRIAASLGGIALYTIPVYGWRTAFGFKVKYFVVFLGLLAIWLAITNRDVLAGAAAAAVLGMWQLAIIFPLVTFALVYQRRGHHGIQRAMLGTAGGIALILAPILLWGAIPAMVVETMFTPLLVTEGGTVLGRLQRLARMLGPLLPIAVLGFVGLIGAVDSSIKRDGWWAPLLGGWFLFQILVLDLDFFPDLIPLYATVAIGLGILVGTDRLTPLPLATVLGIFLFSAIFLLGGFGAGPSLPTPTPVDDPGTVDLDPPYSSDQRRALFWGTQRPDTCRIFFGPTQAKLIEATGGTRTQPVCGQFDPAWRALTTRLSGGA